MSIPVTVVISCAGMGRRLGLSKTKALVHICGRPLIAWQLDALKWVRDLRVVVGYQSQDVIDYVLSVRKDVIFTFNHDYRETGTAASFSKGALGVSGLVVSLDGDLIVRPSHLKAFIYKQMPILGVLEPSTDDPLYALMDNKSQMVTAFDRESNKSKQAMEWSGLCQLNVSQIVASQQMGLGSGHVYQLIEPHLPIPACQIDAREVDTSADFSRAEEWLSKHMHEWDEF